MGRGDLLGSTTTNCPASPHFEDIEEWEVFLDRRNMRAKVYEEGTSATKEIIDPISDDFFDFSSLNLAPFAQPSGEYVKKVEIPLSPSLLTPRTQSTLEATKAAR